MLTPINLYNISDISSTKLCRGDIKKLNSNEVTWVDLLTNLLILSFKIKLPKEFNIIICRRCSYVLYLETLDNKLICEFITYAHK